MGIIRPLTWSPRNSSPVFNPGPRLIYTCHILLFRSPKQRFSLLNKGKDVVILAHSYGGVVAGGAAKSLDKPTRKSQGYAAGVVGLTYVAGNITRSVGCGRFSDRTYAVRKSAPTAGCPTHQVGEELRSRLVCYLPQITMLCALLFLVDLNYMPSQKQGLDGQRRGLTWQTARFF